jgi:hypothetical protein
MRNLKLPIATCAALLALALGATGTASAARIVVLEVRGDDTSDFEDMLVDSLKGQHDVVESRAFDRAARREGVGDDLDARAIAKVARSLEAVAIIDPMLAKRDGEWEFMIKVRGQDGKVKRKMKIELDAPRLGAKGKKKVSKAILEVIDEVLDKNPAPRAVAKAKPRTVQDEEEDDNPLSAAAPKGKPAKGKSKPKVAARPVDEPAERKARGRGDDEEDEVDDDEDEEDQEARPARRGGDGDEADEEDLDEDRDQAEDEEDDEEDRPRRKKSRSGGREIRRAGIMVETGASMITRKLSFTSRDFEQAPRGYPGSPVPAAHAAGELYPVAIASQKNIGAILGVYGEFDKVMSLTTRTSQAMDVPLKTEQVRWTVGGKLRYAFGKAPNLPSIYAGMGYGRRAFKVDRSDLPEGVALDLPDVDYRIYEPQLGLRFPVGTERLALTVGGRFFLMKKAGAIQNPAEYGAARITGGEGEAIIDAAITRMILLRLRGSYTLIGYDFVGNGEQTNNRDGNADTQDVGGARDVWIGATAALAVIY